MLNFGSTLASIDVSAGGELAIAFDTGDARWGGTQPAVLDGSTLAIPALTAVLLTNA